MWVSTKPNRQLVNLLEVLLGLCRCGCAQTLVVLHWTACRRLLESLLRKKPLFARFDDRCHHADHKFKLNQLWPIHVNHVQDETLDVTAVQVCISHNHETPVP